MCYKRYPWRWSRVEALAAWPSPQRLRVNQSWGCSPEPPRGQRGTGRRGLAEPAVEHEPATETTEADAGRPRRRRGEQELPWMFSHETGTHRADPDGRVLLPQTPAVRGRGRPTEARPAAVAEHRGDGHQPHSPIRIWLCQHSVCGPLPGRAPAI